MESSGLTSLKATLMGSSTGLYLPAPCPGPSLLVLHKETKNLVWGMEGGSSFLLQTTPKCPELRPCSQGILWLASRTSSTLSQAPA